jgi:glycosyltransferase involved in cell wall biosynthesis
VLFVGTTTVPPLGADTQVHVLTMRSLDRSAHRLHAACNPGSGPTFSPTYQALQELDGVRLVLVDLGPELYLRSFGGKLRGLIATAPALPSLVRLARYVRRNRIQILHSSDRPRDAAAAVLLARLTGAKSVVQCHNGYGPWMSRLLRWSLRHADARVAVSAFVARSFVENGYAAGSTFVVHNAIDLAGWIPGVGRDEARRELGLPDEAPVVISVCRLFPSKGPEDLIRAIALIQCAHPSVRLLVVGRDLTGDGSYTRHLTELADGLGVGDRVIFTGQRRDVPRLMAAADVFAMPSSEEPFGLVFVEAMAMELPVVALATGGAPEVVEHGRTGLLSERGDLNALARNLSTLLDGDRLRRQMGANGRRRVEETFTVERMAREVADVYRLVVSDRIGGSGEVEGAGHAGHREG